MKAFELRKLLKDVPPDKEVYIPKYVDGNEEFIVDFELKPVTDEMTIIGYVLEEKENATDK